MVTVASNGTLLPHNRRILVFGCLRPSKQRRLRRLSPARLLHEEWDAADETLGSFARSLKTSQEAVEALRNDLSSEGCSSQAVGKRNVLDRLARRCEQTPPSFVLLQNLRKSESKAKEKIKRKLFSGHLPPKTELRSNGNERNAGRRSSAPRSPRSLGRDPGFDTELVAHVTARKAQLAQCRHCAQCRALGLYLKHDTSTS